MDWLSVCVTLVGLGMLGLCLRTHRLRGRTARAASAGSPEKSTAAGRPSRRAGGAVLRFAAVFAVWFVSLAALSLRWALGKWAELTAEEIVIQLSAIQGTSGEFVREYILRCLLPSVALGFSAAALLWLEKGKDWPRRWTALGLLVLSAAIFAAAGRVAWVSFGVGDFLDPSVSLFIDEHYVDPENVELRFPEKKRNLIYIYLESMEITFSDKANGGAFPRNIIPELTELAKGAEDFSGESASLNGGCALFGNTWTVGAMLGQSAGLPMKVGDNFMSTQNSFYPEITTLGDILDKAGYEQVLMIGSEGEFGGRGMYFSGHGNYRIEDYNYAIQQGWIPPDYYAWWGYEDEKLFAFAKEELLSLAVGDKPFNLTLLTADTHFEDGYVCRLCRDDFGDNQYANVMACSSRQTADFVRWVQQQDFYEDTTVVLMGDHPTMDNDFCQDVPADYSRRVYTAYINAAVQPAEPSWREYSTQDAFPTTLAALGVEIEGERLGLGTNLFSTQPTLCESYGMAMIDREYTQKSPLIDRIQQVQIGEETVSAVADVYRFYDPEENSLSFVTKDLYTTLINPKAVTYRIRTDPDNTWDTFLCEVTDGVAQGTVSLADYPAERLYIDLCVLLTGGEYIPYRHIVQDTALLSNEPAEYFRLLAESGYDVLIAACDDASVGLTENIRRSMGNLGLLADACPGFAWSYTASVTASGVREAMSPETLTEDGRLSDGKPYSLLSKGYEAGNDCSIVINGAEYATDRRGLSIAVYDPQSGEVVDCSWYDTYLTVSAGLGMEYWSEEEHSAAFRIRIPPEPLPGEEPRKWEPDPEGGIGTGPYHVELWVTDEERTLPWAKYPAILQADGSYLAWINNSLLPGRDLSLAVYVLGQKKTLVEAFSYTGTSRALWKYMADYLNDLARSREDSLVLIGVKDEASNGLTEQDRDALQAIGLEYVPQVQFQWSYAAVLDGDKITERVGKSRQSVSGKTAEGVAYSVDSGGALSMNHCSIVLDGVEYAPNIRGFNIVVYDKAKGRVTEAVWFDTYPKGNAEQIPAHVLTENISPGLRCKSLKYVSIPALLRLARRNIFSPIRTR